MAGRTHGQLAGVGPAYVIEADVTTLRHEIGAPASFVRRTGGWRRSATARRAGQDDATDTAATYSHSIVAGGFPVMS